MRSTFFALVLAFAAFALSQTPPDAGKAQITKLQHAYAGAQAALKKHPNSPSAKHAFVVAADMYATAAMTTTSMTPHQRYPLALRLYRQVLKIDPKNHEAKNNSEMIISVYKSMGRPIPK